MTASIIPLSFDGGAGPDTIHGTDDDLPFGPLACGASGTGPCDFFAVPTGGGNSGKKTLLIVHRIPDDVDGDGTFDLNTSGPDSGHEIDLIVELVATNGAFSIGTTELTTAPDAIASSPFMPLQSGMRSYDAAAYIAVRAGTQINTLYTAASGSLKMSAIDPAGDTPNTLIRGTLGPIQFVQTDGSMVGGCTTTLDGFSFTLEQGR